MSKTPTIEIGKRYTFRRQECCGSYLPGFNIPDGAHVTVLDKQGPHTYTVECCAGLKWEVYDNELLPLPCRHGMEARDRRVEYNYGGKVTRESAPKGTVVVAIETMAAPELRPGQRYKVLGWSALGGRERVKLADVPPVNFLPHRFRLPME